MIDSNSYEDIIGLPHHVSKTRPRMDRENRAAQFSPFAALTGYDAAVVETARLTDRRIELAEDKKARLDERLQILLERVHERPKVSVIYFKQDERKAGGSYENVCGTVSKIDEFEQLIVFADGKKIPVEDIYDIEGELYRFLDENNQ